MAADEGHYPREDVLATRNIEALVKAGFERQDELRKVENASLRRDIKQQKIHDRELRKSESSRLDAIRNVDVAAVAAQVVAASEAASTLAATVASSAEALRGQVVAQATAQTISQRGDIAPLQKDIADLRKAQYESAGERTQVVETRAKGASTGLWLGLAIGIIGLGASTMFSVVAVVITLLLR